MEPIDFPQKNFDFKKPANMTDEQCKSLPVFKGLDAAGYPIIISCWELSPEDLQQINSTGKVWLSILGTGMPPVAVMASTPFADVQEIPTEKQWPESSNVMGAKYFKDESKLQVSFKNGKVYDYEGVPDSVWAEMVVAESGGSFLAAKIKGKYKASRFN